MKKVAIVILNYLNYWDTVNCVDSIQLMEYGICGIVVVDNGSDNKSYSFLKKKYLNQDGIQVIRLSKNLGFARGNNVGINYARTNLGAEFVLVVNNDTLFIEKNYINAILNEYQKGIGVLGSKIKVKNGMIQQKYNAYVTFPETFLCYIRVLMLKYKMFDVGEMIENKFSHRRCEIMHGCVLMFTPDYFKKYGGFYPHTFLYCEEEILYLYCKYAGLQQKKVNTAIIMHLEDQSSEQSFANKKDVKIKYIVRSYKHVLLVQIYGVFLKIKKFIK